MKDKLRIGIIGCGAIARAHLEAYRAAGVEIAQVFDVVATAAQQFATEAGARVASSIQSMADSGELDAVSICTPPAMHPENARPFLAARVPVLCEKPLAATRDQARDLADAVRRSGTLFMSAFCHRFHGPILELRALIRSGRLGEPVYFRNIFGGFAEFRGNHRVNPALSGGGCVMDNGAHSVDLFRFLVGEPTRVQAMTGNVLQAIPVEDFGFIHLSMDERIFGEITLSYSLKGCGNWLEWYGSKGRAMISYWNPGVPELTYLGDGDKEPVTVDCSKNPDRITAEIAHFLECVRTGEQPRITVEDGLRANEIIAAVYDSARSGWSVKLPPA